MKTLIPHLFFAVFLIGTEAHAISVAEPTAHAKSYLVVGISGFKTGREKADAGNILSDKVGKSSQPSGAWTNLNRKHKRIFKNAFLTHFSTDEEIESVLKLTEDKNGNCRSDLGLIMMSFSWGAKTSRKLANRYYEKCQTLPHLVIMIDAISKPTPFSYKKSIMAFNCVNYYQLQSKLHGAPIENCLNHDLKYDKKDLVMGHIRSEWEGSEKGNTIIESFLNKKLPVLFVRDQYQIDYQWGLNN